MPRWLLEVHSHHFPVRAPTSAIKEKFHVDVSGAPGVLEGAWATWEKRSSLEFANTAETCRQTHRRIRGSAHNEIPGNTHTHTHTHTHTRHLRSRGRKLITRIVEVERRRRDGGGRGEHGKWMFFSDTSRLLSWIAWAITVKRRL